MLKTTTTSHAVSMDDHLPRATYTLDLEGCNPRVEGNKVDFEVPVVPLHGPMLEKEYQIRLRDLGIADEELDDICDEIAEGVQIRLLTHFLKKRIGASKNRP